MACIVIPAAASVARDDIRGLRANYGGSTAITDALLLLSNAT